MEIKKGIAINRPLFLVILEDAPPDCDLLFILSQ
jgi:hypothetical protein